jgi:hypothetical protein
MGRARGNGAVLCRFLSSRSESLARVNEDRSAAVDFRLARNAVLVELRANRLAKEDVCDAHPELLRAAKAGRRTEESCPVCDDADLVHVTYAFGPRLPSRGRCVESAAELRRLDRSGEELNCYVVEVCPRCSWNHLVRRVPVGGRRRRS